MRASACTVLVAAVALATGCVYSTPDMGYRTHPELVNVHLAAGKRDRRTELLPNFGMVRGRAASWNGCEEAVTEATSNMKRRSPRGRGMAGTSQHAARAKSLAPPGRRRQADSPVQPSSALVASPA